jgi:hypothetical protein
MIPGEVAKSIADKLEAVLRRCLDVAEIELVGQVLRGDNFQENFVSNSEAIASMKYAPLTPCNVERSFLAFKRILTDDRKRFTPDNL